MSSKTVERQTVWRNWGRTEQARPNEVVSPQSVDELAQLVTRAQADGRRVKPVGAGHSFTGIAVAPDIQISMERMRGLVSADESTGEVTLRAGTHLFEIPGLLAPYGLAMTNLGDVDRQTISGATSTGTHGTGGQFGGIATQITGVRLIDGHGRDVHVAAGDSRLAGAALGLGALGVLTEITLRCVPAFKMRAVEEPGTFENSVSGFADNVGSTDHHEFYWFPHTDVTLTKFNTRLGLDEPDTGPSAVRRWVDDELLANKFFGALCSFESRVPSVTPALNQVSARVLSARQYVAPAHEVLISARNVRFREMEYAIPIEAVPDALREVRAMIDRRGYRVSFPVEVRAAAADDLMISTASGRASGYIAVHRYVGDRPDSYFDDVEAIMVAHEGRPHWGKMHTRDAAYFAGVYPRFGEFLALRDQFDPDRVFANDYLTRVLGE
ncbi:D-arabinono-1,4-lactone oxidase [Branchiibius sp. NY16-3462-2]|uniref:D-arabinono-1,4-lactone oxidase n=1 Tax=Branchiibius sp. NY16-3462-2 TaxID=1807500 RepID=UPI00079614BC|nr:D-arabinono-1,4-lactone oxidase [Branchiibius sp. NY16-3462-2]KYH43942.1 FAD-linked oxidoreductase [Branchiibius sp. NY16-3462-2]